MVVPPFTTLLWLLPWYLGSDLLPAFRSFLFNKIGELSVFLDGPGTLYVSDQVRFQEMSPPMQALVITATLNMLSNFTPVSCAVLQLCHNKLIILLSSPMTFDDIRIENNVPPLMALLLCPSTDIL